MKVAGFWNGHDCSFCILENGKPVIHAELERYIREKEPKGDSVDFFLDVMGKEYKNIDYVALSDGIVEFESVFNKFLSSHDVPNDFKDKIKEWSNNKFTVLGHHLAHAANAFFSSNLEESLILTIDGGGWEALNEEGKGIPSKRGAFIGKSNKIKEILNIDDYNIGGMWTNFTRLIFGLSVGYPYGHSAGTVMAMASIGNRTKFIDKIMELEMQFPNYFNGMYPDCDDQLKYDVAASLQHWTEIRIREYIAKFYNENESYCKNLCLSGGVILNSVVVGKIKKWFPFENIYVCPVPYDGGQCIGAAQYLYHHILDYPRVTWKDNFSPYLGELYDLEDIKKSLKKYSDKVSFITSDDEDVLNLLENQKIISVFGGGSESGRRALGDRSILADPRSPDMKGMINEKVKHRQWFRPFAPSILREEVSNWFEYDVDSPYMNFVLPFKEEVRDKIPAVLHLDNTGRLQTVTKNDNKWYYNFIKKWKDKTDVPILLNTSFNDREPIVETPEHAINCYLKTNIDYLYFYDEKILVSKV